MPALSRRATPRSALRLAAALQRRSSWLRGILLLAVTYSWSERQSPTASSSPRDQDAAAKLSVATAVHVHETRAIDGHGHARAARSVHARARPISSELRPGQRHHNSDAAPAADLVGHRPRDHGGRLDRCRLAASPVACCARCGRSQPPHASCQPRNLHERLALDGPRRRAAASSATRSTSCSTRLEASFDVAAPVRRQRLARAAHAADVGARDPRGHAGRPRSRLSALRAACERVLALGEQQEHLIDALLTLARSERGLGAAGAGAALARCTRGAARPQRGARTARPATGHPPRRRAHHRGPTPDRAPGRQPDRQRRPSQHSRRLGRGGDQRRIRTDGAARRQQRRA